MMEAEGRPYPERGDTGGSERGPEPEAPERGLVLSSLVGPASREDRDALATPDDVIVALYESLSYPHGGLPNLDRFRSLSSPPPRSSRSTATGRPISRTSKGS